MKYALLLGIAVTMLTGCLDAIDPIDPQVGGALAPRCANQDSDPDNDVSFSMDILPMFRRRHRERRLQLPPADRRQPYRVRRIRPGSIELQRRARGGRQQLDQHRHRRVAV